MFENKKIITFDCYGTLIDWDKGIEQFFRDVFSKMKTAELELLQKKWETMEFDLLGSYVPYAELHEKSFVKLLKSEKMPTKKNLGKLLTDRIYSWKTFPEVYTVLGKLKKIYKLALISNGSPELLKSNARSMGIDFDYIISAEDMKAYKPSLKVFQYASQKMGCPFSEMLHIAAGYKYDVIPAIQLGLSVIWVNRKNMTPGVVKPNFEINNLDELIKLLI